MEQCRKKIKERNIGNIADFTGDIKPRKSTSKFLFKKLACHKRAFIREIVARNVGAPSDILSELAKDEDECVRSAVASNTGTDSETLELLMGDDSLRVKNSLISNPSSPLSIFVRLSRDTNKEIRLMANYRLGAKES